MKRFTDAEIQTLKETMELYRNNNIHESEAFKSLAEESGIRPATSYRDKWYAIKKKEKGKPKVPKHPILDSVKQILIENEQMAKRIKELEKQAAEFQPMKLEYEALLEIMNRARKMAYLYNEEETPGPKFKMDANGNLERIETKEE